MNKSRLIIALFLALSFQTVRAADAPAAKSRTIKDLNTLVMTRGEDDTLGENVVHSLELGSDKLPIKELYYEQTITPDGYEHIYALVQKDSKPQGIVWTTTKITEVGDKKTIEGYSFHADLNGKLKHAIRAEGVMGEVVHTKLKNNSTTAALFKKETEFWTKKTVGLEWSK